MKVFLAITVLATMCAMAQEGPVNGPRANGREGRGDGPGRMPPPPANMGNFVAKMALSEDFGKSVELSDEQKAKLKVELGSIETNCCALEEKIISVSRKQGELARKVLETPNMKADEMFALIEEIGKLRTEQAKASVRTLMIIRDTLTPAQREKSRTFIKEQTKARMLERRMDRIKFKADHNNGDGPGGMRPQPGKDDENDIPPPPKEGGRE